VANTAVADTEVAAGTEAAAGTAVVAGTEAAADTAAAVAGTPAADTVVVVAGTGIRLLEKMAAVVVRKSILLWVSEGHQRMAVMAWRGPRGTQTVAASKRAVVSTSRSPRSQRQQWQQRHHRYRHVYPIQSVKIKKNVSAEDAIHYEMGSYLV
jgi:hypothetical protein